MSGESAAAALSVRGIGKHSADIVMAALEARNRKEALPPETVMMDYRVIARETT